MGISKWKGREGGREGKRRRGRDGKWVCMEEELKKSREREKSRRRSVKSRNNA